MIMGASGRIGQRISELLLERGEKVRALGAQPIADGRVMCLGR
jgi:uncharacterized protein YbjT (DUF2867 family)